MRVSRRLWCCFDAARSSSSSAIRAAGEEGGWGVGAWAEGHFCGLGILINKGVHSFFFFFSSLWMVPDEVRDEVADAAIGGAAYTGIRSAVGQREIALSQTTSSRMRLLFGIFSYINIRSQTSSSYLALLPSRRLCLLSCLSAHLVPPAPHLALRRHALPRLIDSHRSHRQP